MPKGETTTGKKTKSGSAKTRKGSKGSRKSRPAAREQSRKRR